MQYNVGKFSTSEVDAVILDRGRRVGAAAPVTKTWVSNRISSSSIGVTGYGVRMLRFSPWVGAA